MAETPFPDVFCCRFSRKGFYLAIKGTVTHCHLVGNESQVDIFTHDIVFDKFVQTVNELQIKAAHLWNGILGCSSGWCGLL